MRKAKSDTQIAEEILADMEGSSELKRQKARKIVRVVGKRIRLRHRDRDAQSVFAKSVRDRQSKKTVLGK
jgi:hypothetical protein